jgi:hypothetical protein
MPKKPLVQAYAAARVEEFFTRPKRTQSEAPPEIQNPKSKIQNHGGPRPNAGRPKKTHPTKKVTIELHQHLLDTWDAHCTKHQLSRPEALAKLLKWKRPKP